MSRPLRVEYPGALYHVVSHGNGRLWLFKHDDAYSTFLDVLEEYIKKYYVVIHNFVVMRNHFHLIVETKLSNLGVFMNQVLRDYAMYFNRVSRRRGSVFRSRYGAFLVQKDVYYRQLTKYVFFNPVKARLVKHPGEYKYSSLWYIMRRDKSIRWFDPKVSLSLIGGRRALAEMLADRGIPASMEPVYNQFYGDRKWADDLIDKSKLSEEIRGHGLMEKGYITVGEILKAVAKYYRLSEKAVIGGYTKDATMVAIYLVNMHTPRSLSEIGKLFKAKKFALAQRLRRFKQGQLKQRRFRKAVCALEKQLLGK
jgi:REP element-mobilizing transposase RayT